VADTSHQTGSYSADEFPSQSDFWEITWDTDLTATTYSTATKKVVVNVDNDRYDVQGMGGATPGINDTSWSGNVASAVGSVPATSWTIETCSDLGGGLQVDGLIRLNARVRDYDTSAANAQVRGADGEINVLAKMLRAQLSPVQVIGVADVTAPLVTGCSTANITQTSFTVSCAVNEASACQLFWGPDGGARTATSGVTQSTSGVCSNLVASGLTAGTAYDWHMAATDAAGNTGVSSTGDVTTQSPPPAGCSLYAAQSAQGSGNHSSQANAGLVSTAWSKLDPGETLCLLDGTYTGANSMLVPPTTLAGTSTNRIVIRALNDGAVLVDGQGVRAPVSLSTNNRFLDIEGINAREGSCHSIFVTGQNNTLRRVIAWDANFGSSQLCHPVIFDSCTDCLFEDGAAFGAGWRTILVYQSLRTTIRRVWSRWNNAGFLASPNEDPPGKALETSYRSHLTLVENSFFTRSVDAGQAGNAGDQEILGIGCVSCGDSLDPHGGTYGTESRVRVLGSMVYLRNADADNLGSTNRGQIWTANNDSQSRTTLQDVVSWADTSETTNRPLRLNAASGEDNLITRFTSISPIASRIANTDLGTISSSTVSGWSISNHKTWASIAAAGASLDIWDGASQANICKRYVNGTLTATNLWPWPMDDRISAALVAAGTTTSAVFGAASFQAFLEDTFGAIPAGCGG
jgi:hypothetical protein